MQHRLMTEYEWRRQMTRSCRRPSWVGAQCVYAPVWQRRLFQNRPLQRLLLLFSVLLASLFALIPEKDAECFADIVISASNEPKVRQVSAVQYERPRDLSYENIVLTRTKLLQGKLLLLDEEHPLPDDVLPPNTASIVMAGNGMVPVRSLDLKTGWQTIDALKTLFSALREKGIGGVYVCRASMSKSQQKREMMAQMRSLMPLYAPEEAAERVWQGADKPGTGELIQEYAVDLCIINPLTNQPETRPLDETEQGQELLQLAWRYGWICTDRDRSYRFRYVGKAHATAMTYLDLELADYLALLHQKKTLAILAGGQPQYLIFCQPIKGERVAFDLPFGASYEASLDNTGYAVVACTL